MYMLYSFQKWGYKGHTNYGQELSNPHDSIHACTDEDYADDLLSKAAFQSADKAETQRALTLLSELRIHLGDSLFLLAAGEITINEYARLTQRPKDVIDFALAMDRKWLGMWCRIYAKADYDEASEEYDGEAEDSEEV